MKLTDLFEEEQKGTYAGVRFSESTVDMLYNYVNKVKIPNPVLKNKYHTTLLYSRKHLPDYKAAGVYTNPMVGNITKLDVWESAPDENGDTKKCLVLEYDCEELTSRHEELMEKHGATHDYPEYKTHVTLSYDIGDMDISEIELPEQKELEIVKEYQEDLNLNWAHTDGGLKDE